MTRLRLGVRGAVLLRFGAVTIAYGVSLWIDRAALADSTALALLVDLVPPSVLAIVWIAGGALAVLQAWARQPARDTAAFVVVAALYGGWACALGLSGAGRSTAVAAIFGLASSLALTCSRIVEPPVPLPDAVDDDGEDV